jgi:hypothetical protein
VVLSLEKLDYQTKMKTGFEMTLTILSACKPEIIHNTLLESVIENLLIYKTEYIFSTNRYLYYVWYKVEYEY